MSLFFFQTDPKLVPACFTQTSGGVIRSGCLPSCPACTTVWMSSARSSLEPMRLSAMKWRYNPTAPIFNSRHIRHLLLYQVWLKKFLKYAHKYQNGLMVAFSFPESPVLTPIKLLGFKLTWETCLCARIIHSLLLKMFYFDRELYQETQLVSSVIIIHMNTESIWNWCLQISGLRLQMDICKLTKLNFEGVM